MTDLTVDGAKMFANGWLEIQGRIDALLVEQERLAGPLERAADAYFKAWRAYTRTGQCPTVTAVGEHGVKVDVSNGRDRGDDFEARLTWDDLSLDPALVGKRRRAEERARRLAKARELRQRAARLEAGGEDDD